MPLVRPRRRRLLSVLVLAAVAGSVLTPVAASAAGPGLEVSAATVATDETVTFTFDAGEETSPTNWIGIYRDGDEPGGPASLDWRYVPDATGTVEWGPQSRDGWTKNSGAIGAGEYDVYLLHADGYDAIAGPLDLTVTADAEPEPAPTTPPKPAVDGVSELSVLTFNLWHGGTQIDDGPAVIADIIRDADADVVFTPEKGAITGELAALLGFDFVDATDTGVISRYPILESGTVGSDWTKAVIDVNGTETVVYGGHLEYRWYANYLPRGYGGEIIGDYPAGWNTWDQLDAPVTDVDRILEASNGSDRPEEAAAVVADAAVERENGRLTLLGGDFNEPSGEDWTAETADMFDHNGTVIDWPALRVLLDDGMIDSYRQKFPDPVTHPGITWAIENPAFDPSVLTWTPEADERDRIDFVFYSPDERIALEDSVIVGPQGTIVRGDVVGPDSADPIVTPAGVWPSDHKAVLSTFSVCAAGCAAAPEPEPSPGPSEPTPVDPAPTDPPVAGGPDTPAEPGDGAGVGDEAPSDDLAVTGAQNAMGGWWLALGLLALGVVAAIVARVRVRRSVR